MHELLKTIKTEQKTSTSQSKEKSQPQKNKPLSDGKTSSKHVADERKSSSNTAQEKKSTLKNDRANVNSQVPEPAKVLNFNQTLQNEIFSNTETKSTSLITKQHVDAVKILPAESFTSNSSKNNDAITEKQPSTNVTEKEKKTFNIKNINQPIEEKTMERQTKSDNEYIEQTTSIHFPEIVETRQINQQVAISIEPNDVLKEIGHKVHEPEVISKEPTIDKVELNADPTFVGNSQKLKIDAETDTIQETTKKSPVTTLHTLKEKTPSKSYVIEVVNENEFSCYVSLNRKKKKKKKSQ
jgi:hypothetical protein